MCEFVMRQTAHKSQQRDNENTNTMKIPKPLKCQQLADFPLMNNNNNMQKLEQ
jgi:hypothetical protein